MFKMHITYADRSAALDSSAEHAQNDCTSREDAENEVGGEEGAESDTDESRDGESEQRHRQQERGTIFVKTTIFVDVVDEADGRMDVRRKGNMCSAD